jgi:hypothetical protein
MENTIENKKPAHRPSEYKPEYCQKADEYLEMCQDEMVQVVKQANAEKGYEMFENKLKVSLPTHEGFAKFIGVCKKTLYNWADENDEFLHSLEKITIEQKERLLNSGLSGDYNPTIAKLILSSNHQMSDSNKTDITSGGEKITGNAIVFESYKDETKS